MDLTSLDRIRAAHDRAELALGPRSAPLAGGTWLFSEPQPRLDELVDLTTLGWPAVELTDDGLTLAATCTIRSLADLPPVPGWRSQHLVAAVRAVAGGLGEDLGLGDGRREHLRGAARRAP